MSFDVPADWDTIELVGRTAASSPPSSRTTADVSAPTSCSRRRRRGLARRLAAARPSATRRRSSTATCCSTTRRSPWAATLGHPPAHDPRDPRTRVRDDRVVVDGRRRHRRHPDGQRRHAAARRAGPRRRRRRGEPRRARRAGPGWCPHERDASTPRRPPRLDAEAFITLVGVRDRPRGRLRQTSRAPRRGRASSRTASPHPVLRNALAAVTSSPARSRCSSPGPRRPPPPGWRRVRQRDAHRPRRRHLRLRGREHGVRARRPSRRLTGLQARPRLDRGPSAVVDEALLDDLASNSGPARGRGQRGPRRPARAVARRPPRRCAPALWQPVGRRHRLPGARSHDRAPAGVGRHRRRHCCGSRPTSTVRCWCRRRRRPLWRAVVVDPADRRRDGPVAQSA